MLRHSVGIWLPWERQSSPEIHAPFLMFFLVSHIYSKRLYLNVSSYVTGTVDLAGLA